MKRRNLLSLLELFYRRYKKLLWHISMVITWGFMLFMAWVFYANVVSYTFGISIWWGRGISIMCVIIMCFTLEYFYEQ